MEREVQRIEFLEHKTFARRIKKFNKKYSGGGNGYRHLKKLLIIHFSDSSNPMFTKKVLRRIDRVGANIEVYKITMNVKGLSQGQCPRICFWYVGKMIVFLAFGTHIENYKDDQLKKLVKMRIQEIDPSAILD